MRDDTPYQRYAAGAADEGEGTLTRDEVLATETAEPVAGFPMRYKWHTGPWQKIFDRQTRLIQEDVLRARFEDRVVVYLSCPISSRGGGYAGTNVDIAKFVERRLLQQWGEGFWILNPAQYQMESKEGFGLLQQHAQEEGIPFAELMKLSKDENDPRKSLAPSGGDYMRMWTRVLVQDDKRARLEPEAGKLPNTGQHFDAFYFIGPSDVQSFFMQGGVSFTAGIEQYFARRHETDPDFRDYFAVAGIEWGSEHDAAAEKRNEWERKRKRFLRYYAVRAGANFSLGSHDEWNLLRLLNERRRAGSTGEMQLDGDPGEQIAAFFDGRQVELGSSEFQISRGYEQAG